MKLNGKTVAGFLATTALAFGLTARAEPPGAGCEGKGPGMGMMHDGMKMMGDPAARAEQRLSQLKSQLGIDARQEPLWTAFAEKMKAEAGQGMKAMREQAQEPMTAPERMGRMMSMMRERTAAMQSVSDAFKRLYDALTPAQKAVADKQSLFGGPMMPPPMDKPGGPAPQDKAAPAGHSH